jgi:hypothetical protein
LIYESKKPLVYCGSHRQQEAGLELLDAPEMSAGGQGVGQPGFMSTHATADGGVKLPKTLDGTQRWQHKLDLQP